MMPSATKPLKCWIGPENELPRRIGPRLNQGPHPPPQLRGASGRSSSHKVHRATDRDPDPHRVVRIGLDYATEARVAESNPNEGGAARLAT